ncbi:MAG: reverse transcriptase family protein [Nautiliaceae bacterium]
MEKLFKYINLYIIKNAKNKKIKPLTNINKLYYFAYFCDDKFITFEIPKYNDKKRTIYTTKYKTHKIILEAINEYLYEKVKLPRYVHGYVKKKNVVTNAKVHVGKKYVFKVDIKDFFPSIHKGKIIWALKNYLNLDEKQAFLIASLATVKIDGKEFLPQGFPTSPVLSNLVLKRVDRRLIGIAKKYHIKYTRYADDITFSSDKNIFDENFINEVEKILNKDGFKLNYEKIKLLKKGYRQTVTGLVVNEKLNVKREYVKLLRTLLFYLEKNIEQYGKGEGIKKAQILFEEKSNSKKDLLKVIEGKLAYLKNIKGEDDSTYKKLKSRYDKITGKNKTNCINHNPKKVVEILSKFSNDEDLKFVLHKWRGSANFTYDEFIKKVKNKWKEYEKELHKLNYKLNAKIYNFLLHPNPKWGNNKEIEYGWSSHNLIECFRNIQDPFDCELNDGNGRKFEDIIKLFKEEIRLNGEKLLKLIDNIIKENNLKSEKKDLKEREKLYEMKETYIDTQWFKIGLERLFQGIKEHGKTNKIELQFEEFDDFYELYIINIDSNANKNHKELIGGDFSFIKEAFCSVVDWSIIWKYNNQICKFDVFKNEEKFQNNYDFRGFTHKIKIYKRVMNDFIS